MVCKKIDCSLQSIKITFSSVHCHNVGTSASATGFPFAHSQNKKCKLKFIDKLEDDVWNWEKIPKNVWIVSKYVQHYSRSIVGWCLFSQWCNRSLHANLSSCDMYCDLIHFLNKWFLQRNLLCFVFTYQARCSQCWSVLSFIGFATRCTLPNDALTGQHIGALESEQLLWFCDKMTKQLLHFNNWSVTNRGWHKMLQ